MARKKLWPIVQSKRRKLFWSCSKKNKQ